MNTNNFVQNSQIIILGYLIIFYRDMILSSFQKYNNSYIKINNEFSSVSNLSAAIILKELLKHKSNKEKGRK